MNIVFDFLNYASLYEKCVLASVVHAIMVGEYDLLSAEQSWDGLNYNFQNMEGVRGVISFAEDRYICVVQNDAMYENYAEHHVSELLHGAETKMTDLAQDEALQYMLVDHKGKTVAFISAAFWGDKEINYSNLSEEQIIKISEGTVMPFLYNQNDAKMYWKDYYEMTNEQIEFAEDLCKRRIFTKGKMKLAKNEIDQLKEWFDDISECIESFRELDIYLY